MSEPTYKYFPVYYNKRQVARLKVCNGAKCDTKEKNTINNITRIQCGDLQLDKDYNDNWVIQNDSITFGIDNSCDYTYGSYLATIEWLENNIKIQACGQVSGSQTTKHLRALLSQYNVPGRSKLTTKAAMLRALKKLKI